MIGSDNFGSFIRENKKLVKEYLDLKLEIYRLKLARILSKSAGYFAWMIVMFLLLFLFFIFLGLVAGFWMSELTGSYTKGFGIATLFLLFIIVLLTSFRKSLFINPIIKGIIHKMDEAENENHKPS